MKKFLISGSSASAGHGLTNEEMTRSFWPASLIKTRFPGCDIVNKSIIGADNSEIFNETYANIKTGNFTDAMITWSVMPRANINMDLNCTELPVLIYPLGITLMISI